MKIAVTGAGGFVGQRLVPFLAEKGQQVVPLHRGDLGAPDFQRADVVIHLAAIAHSGGVDDQEYDEINRALPIRLARAAAEQGVRRFVFLSTTHAISHADTPYGRAKAAAELELLSLSGIEIAVVRSPLIYGPGVKANMRALIRLSQLPVPLPFGNANEKRSLIYIDNLCDALLFASREETPSSSIYCAADSHPLSLAEIISLYRAGAGRNPGLFPAPWLPNLLRMFGMNDLEQRLFAPALFDASSITRAGWSPPYTAADAMRMTAAADAQRRL